MIKIAIADDHAIVRRSLAATLGQEPDMRVVGEAADGQGALDIVRVLDVDVLVLDVDMPRMSATDTLKKLSGRRPSISVLVLSGYPPEVYALSMLKLGAAGYLAKDCLPEEIVEAVRTVSKGRRFITPAVGELLASRLGVPMGARHLALSDREFQVLLRLGRGSTTGQTAKELSLSVKAITTYRNHLLKKMELRSNTEITYYLMKHGLLD